MNSSWRHIYTPARRGAIPVRAEPEATAQALVERSPAWVAVHHRENWLALFGDDAIPDRDWISHELRDQTARLIRLGYGMMRGGYRRLLLHPYRRRR